MKPNRLIFFAILLAPLVSLAIYFYWGYSHRAKRVDTSTMSTNSPALK